jgi:hypothetical protein
VEFVFKMSSIYSIENNLLTEDDFIIEKEKMIRFYKNLLKNQPYQNSIKKIEYFIYLNRF